jgi:hypothetical protein
LHNLFIYRLYQASKLVSRQGDSQECVLIFTMNEVTYQFVCSAVFCIAQYQCNHP